MQIPDVGDNFYQLSTFFAKVVLEEQRDPEAELVAHSAKLVNGKPQYHFHIKLDGSVNEKELRTEFLINLLFANNVYVLSAALRQVEVDESYETVPEIMRECRERVEELIDDAQFSGHIKMGDFARIT